MSQLRSEHVLLAGRISTRKQEIGFTIVTRPDLPNCKAVQKQCHLTYCNNFLLICKFAINQCSVLIWGIQAQTTSSQYGLGAIDDVKNPENGSHMHLDRNLCQVQAQANFFVGQALT